ncbi:hypothetical protein C0J52_24376 [Blattella germanica]|nr:hypothetical protein C0J52_24376 [Blattella germanica]
MVSDDSTVRTFHFLSEPYTRMIESTNSFHLLFPFKKSATALRRLSTGGARESDRTASAPRDNVIHAMPGDEVRLGDTPLAEQFTNLILGLPLHQLTEFRDSNVAAGLMTPEQRSFILTAVTRQQAEGDLASEANEASASGGSMDPPLRRSDDRPVPPSEITTASKAKSAKKKSQGKASKGKASTEDLTDPRSGAPMGSTPKKTFAEAASECRQTNGTQVPDGSQNPSTRRSAAGPSSTAENCTSETPSEGQTPVPTPMDHGLHPGLRRNKVPIYVEVGKFYDNRFTNSSKGNIIANENFSNTPITQANLNVAHGVNNRQTPPSASRRKLFETTYGADYSNFNLNSEFERSETGYLLVDLSVLSLSMKKFVACKHCGAEDCVVLLEDQSNQRSHDLNDSTIQLYNLPHPEHEPPFRANLIMILKTRALTKFQEH